MSDQTKRLSCGCVIRTWDDPALAPKLEMCKVHAAAPLLLTALDDLRGATATAQFGDPADEDKLTAAENMADAALERAGKPRPGEAVVVLDALTPAELKEFRETSVEIGRGEVLGEYQLNAPFSIHGATLTHDNKTVCARHLCALPCPDCEEERADVCERHALPMPCIKCEAERA